jgi:hypothetical protein
MKTMVPSRVQNLQILDLIYIFFNVILYPIFYEITFRKRNGNVQVRLVGEVIEIFFLLITNFTILKFLCA